MTAVSGQSPWAAVSGVCLCWAVMGVQAVGAERTVARPDIRVFELPVQPLGTALESFARITNREILYEGRLTEHRRSAEVRGVYAADVALDILLAGTGLEADIQDRGFFILRQSEGPPSDPRQYYVLVQAALRQALCNASSDHRVAARLWVGRSGEVVQVRGLVDTAGLWVERALKGVRIGPPPANFAQPITVVVDAETAAECAAR